MKSEILDLLKKSKSDYISGEEVSESLHVSRTAIWKHIQALREDGYVIDSQPRKGYRLVKVPDRLYPLEITDGLKTDLVGQTVIYYDAVASTNDTAKEIANKDLSSGTIIVAEKQDAGKGRLGRQWSSPHGKGIWFSLILRPQISPAEAPKYTILAGVAVASALLKYPGIKTGIKWPNDILLNGKKLCGILTEMNAEMDSINYIVIGVGINANQENSDFTEEIQQIATSLYEETGVKVDRVKLLQGILEEIEILNEQFTKDGFEQILEKWKKLSITLKAPVTVTTFKDQYHGIAVDIDQDGTLIVQKDKGELVKVFAGDVTLSKGK